MHIIVIVSAKEIVKVSNSSLSKTFVDIARDAGLSAEQANKMFESMFEIFDVKMKEDD